MYFQAHVHFYERVVPAYKNLTVSSELDEANRHVNPRAPVYITTGNAGNRKGHNDVISRTPQEWATAFSEDYGYGRLVVYNATHLYFEQFSAITKNMIDFLWIVKSRIRNF